MIIPCSSLLSLLLVIPSTLCSLWSTPSYSSDYHHLPDDYGVDVTYPIHYPYPNHTITQHTERYQKLLQGCYAFYSQEECDETERGRFKMSLEQPRTQFNYTELGFKKIRTPRIVYDALLSYYRTNKAQRKLEKWSRGYTYTNHWDSPTYMISVEDETHEGGGLQFKEFIWNSINPIIEEWIGHKLRPTSLYGIRVYTNNSILATHVDRLPLVTSCIINVDQEGMTEPWELEVYDHSGKAHNVTMEPGDLVLYESSTVLHGRPFPMNGVNYANIFIHFEPLDHEEMNHRALPSYELAKAAAKGEMEKVQKIIGSEPNSIHERDPNGWTPLHEASRAGQLNIVKYLLEHGADIASVTNSGGSPLWWAKTSLPSNHPLIAYFQSIGAPEIGPPHEEL
jgi:prolyl 4-hydroxylase